MFAVDESLVAKMPGLRCLSRAMFSHRPLGEAVVAVLIDMCRVISRRLGELGMRSAFAGGSMRSCCASPGPTETIRSARSSDSAEPVGTRLRASTPAGKPVSREINAMEREGLIERRRGAIVITDALETARDDRSGKQRVERSFRAARALCVAPNDVKRLGADL